MNAKTIAAAAAAIAALSAPAWAETEFTQLSPSIIFMGEPAPEPEAEAVAAAEERRELPDVLADGELRKDGIRPIPVAVDEQTSAVPEAPSETTETPSAPIEETESSYGS